MIVFLSDMKPVTHTETKKYLEFLEDLLVCQNISVVEKDGTN